MQSPRNPSPRQSSGARSSGYYCRDLHRGPVQPRPHAAFAPWAPAASYPRRIAAGPRSGALPRSIFRARRFGWWVATHSLEDADRWGHLPAVATGGRRSSRPGPAPAPGVRLVPPRPSCLPGGAHAPPAFPRPPMPAAAGAALRSLGGGRGACPPLPPTSALRAATARRRLSWETFRRQPATRRFDESFAPMPSSDERFARQHRGGPPPGFRPASPSPGIDHRLSGPRAPAPPVPPTGWGRASRSLRRGVSLGLAGSRGSSVRVSRRGRHAGGPPGSGLLSGRRASFSPFARATRSASGPGAYLALEGPHLPSRCTLKQRYSARRPPGAVRGSHPLWRGLGPPPGRPAPAPHSASSGRAPPASLAATGNPGWFLLRGVLICLSSARRPRRLGRAHRQNRRGALSAVRRTADGALRGGGASAWSVRGSGLLGAGRSAPRLAAAALFVDARAGASAGGALPFADRAARATRDAREGSIRRFTYGYLVTTSPSSRRGGSRPFAGPGRSPARPVGRSDGRCVQGAGTRPARGAGARLQDIPGARGRSSPRSRPRRGFRGVSRRPAGPASVARVQPRASEGITDLLSPRLPPAPRGQSRGIRGWGLARCRNGADGSRHGLGAAMHHRPRDRESAPGCRSSARPGLVRCTR